MVPRSLLPALAAVVSLVAGLPPASAAVAGTRPGLPAAAGVSSSLPAQTAEEDSPLRLTLDSMTPSVLGRRGPLRFSGTVTNTTDEAWLDINVYPFSSWNDVEPTVATTADELADQMLRGETEDVGKRFTDLDNFSPIDRLEPGETADFTARITAEQVALARSEGVYWVGVHALGQPENDARDGFTDGRARTFVPLVRGDTPRVDTAIALPLRHPVRHRGDGALARTRVWTRILAPGGRLDRMLRFGAAAGVPVSWVVDPAVPTAAGTLAAGNHGRSLEETVGSPAEEPGEDPSATPSEPGEPEEGTGDAPSDTDTDVTDQRTAEERAAANAARTWLGRAQRTLTGEDLLLLPHGDVDVTAAADHDPEWYVAAHDHTGAALDPWGLPGEGAVVPPDGRIPARALPIVAEDTTVLVDDTELGAEVLSELGTAPTVIEVAGRRMVVADSTAAAGGPGPDDPLGAVSLRQQILAETALRALDGGGSMAVALPWHWQPPETPAGAAAFFDGLRVPWLRPVSVATLSLLPATQVDEDRLSDATRESSGLGRRNLATAQRLLRAGERLDRVLYRNDTVGERVAGEAFTTTSYDDADNPGAARQEAQRSIRWISRQLARIRVEAPPSVVLGGDVGLVRSVLVNDTAYAVEVQVRADGGDEVQMGSSPRLRLQPGGRTQVDLEASTAVLGEHDVELVVTDVRGEPLGSVATVPVRATEVSKVIWLVIAVGIALLASAIVARLYRRVRDARRRHRERRVGRAGAPPGSGDRPSGPDSGEPPGAGGDEGAVDR